MEIEYSSEKVRQQCTSIKAAKKLFGGDTRLAQSLMADINALVAAETIRDIVVQPRYHFHALINKGKNGKNLKDYFRKLQ